MLHLSHMDMYVHSTIQANFFPKTRITPLIRTHLNHSDQQCEQQNLQQCHTRTSTGTLKIYNHVDKLIRLGRAARMQRSHAEEHYKNNSYTEIDTNIEQG